MLVSRCSERKKQASSLKRHKDEPELWPELWGDICRLQKLSLDEESKEKLFGLLKDKWFDYTDDKVKRLKKRNLILVGVENENSAIFPLSRYLV